MNVFIPEKLIKEKNIIKKAHPCLDAGYFRLQSSDKLKFLIMGFAALSGNHARIKTYALTDWETMSIISYIPVNFYHVKRKNLFEVFLRRADKTNCDVFYKQWQNAYDDEECNTFFAHTLYSVEPLKETLKKYHYSDGMFHEVLRSDNIPLWYGRKCYQNDTSQVSFEEALSYYGIYEDTKLYRDIHALFYLFCHREDYLVIPESKLLSVVEDYLASDNYLNLFLLNFLTVMEMEDLSSFPNIAYALERKTGTNNTNKQDRFLASYSDTTSRKYRDWQNLIHIDKYFGKDERSRFWRQYQFKNVIYYAFSNSVAMETQEFYIVEFLGKTKGPMYIFSKNVYESKVRLRMSQFNNSALRQYLLRSGLYTVRMEHKKDWQKEFDRLLIQRVVTQRMVHS